MDIILFGLQGAGKGTQAQKMLEHKGFHYFAPGALFRNIVETQPDHPRHDYIKSTLAKGGLVDDDLVLEMLRGMIMDVKDDETIVFDGFPRTLNQMNRLREYLELTRRQYIGIYYDVQINETLRRIEYRKICAKCGHIELSISAEKCSKCGTNLEKRGDDTKLESVLERLATFFEGTFPILASLMKEEKLLLIDASKTANEIYENTIKALYAKGVKIGL